MTSERRTKSQALTAETGWYKDAVIYELHVRAFSDGNEDGRRLQGLTQAGLPPGPRRDRDRLLPFYPSPSATTGTTSRTFRRASRLQDAGGLQEFIREAKRRGLRDKSPSSSSITPPTSTSCSRRRGGPPSGASSGTSTSGATTPRSTGTRGSSSRTSRPRTGPGIRSRRPTTGTGSIPISRTSTSRIPPCGRTSSRRWTSG